MHPLKRFPPLPLTSHLMLVSFLEFPLSVLIDAWGPDVHLISQMHLETWNVVMGWWVYCQWLLCLIIFKWKSAFFSLTHENIFVDFWPVGWTKAIMLICSLNYFHALSQIKWILLCYSSVPLVSIGLCCLCPVLCSPTWCMYWSDTCPPSGLGMDLPSPMDADLDDA